MKFITGLILVLSLNVGAVVKYDKQKFCCKKPQQQNPNMCTYKSFVSTTGCPQGQMPVIFPTNANGQAYVNNGNCPHPDGTVAPCE